MNLNQVTVPCTDLAASEAFYRTLGLRQIVGSPPDYARFECPSGDATLSLDGTPEGPADGGVVVDFELDDLDARVEELKATQSGSIRIRATGPGSGGKHTFATRSGTVSACFMPAGTATTRRSEPGSNRPGLRSTRRGEMIARTGRQAMSLMSAPWPVQRGE